MDTRENPWLRSDRQGYCYHSAIRSYKTETLIRKWREGTCSAKQRATIAYELSLRDPALALSEVKALAANPKFARQKKTLRLCLHHVADVETARELFASGHFDPDALHLAAYTALLEDFLAALPGIDATSAELQMRKLGFLAGPVPNPIVDGPIESEAHASSPARYDQLMVRFLTTAFQVPALSGVRAELAEHLRSTYAPKAYAFLLDRWSRGELNAVYAFAAVPRLGWAQAEAILGGDRLRILVRSFVDELAGPPSQFEDAALTNGWLPGSAQEFPAPQGRTVALGFLDVGRLRSMHTSAAEILLKLGDQGAADVVDRADRLPTALVSQAASHLAYSELCARLERAGVRSDQIALVNHPDAPSDLSLVEKGLDLAASDPDRGCEILCRVARDGRHPHRDEAFARLLELAQGELGEKARRFALHRLGELKDNRATPALLEALVDPSLADARLLILTALAHAGDARAIPTLKRMAAEAPESGAARTLDAILRRS